MPYGRQYIKRSRPSLRASSKVWNKASQAAKARAVGRARKINTAVAKKLRRPFVPRLLKHRSAITTLAKQVNRLQRQQLGLIQRNTHTATPPGGNNLFSRTEPLIFAANNFYYGSDCPIWKAKIGTVGGVPTPEIIQVTNFVKYQTPGGFPSEFNEHSFIAQRQDDTVSRLAFSPVSMMYQIQFHYGDVPPTEDTTWFRVQLFKVKASCIASDQDQTQLPENAGVLQAMADQYAFRRNTLHKDRFTVLQDRWVKMEHHENAGANHDKFRTITLKHVFPKGTLYKPDMESNMVVGSTSVGSADVDFHKKMPAKDIMWCLISTSKDSPGAPYVNIKRWVTWRDQHGTA